MSNMLFANNANTTLSSSLTNSATSMSVTSASAFPSPTGSQYFYCTLADAATQTTIEIVKVTAVSGTTFTIVRGQDGTSGTAFASGAVVSLRLVSASLNDFPKLDENNTFTFAPTFNTALAVGSGGTGVTTSTGTGSVVLNTSPTLTTPSISGGTIDNTPIGATTPAAGTFTTITGQTEVLKGTGQNLLLQSNTFNTSWTLTAASVATGISDPFGGSTAWSLTEDSTTSGHYVNTSLTSVNGLTYTYSAYLKQNTRTCAQLILTSIGTAGGNVIAGFDLTAGTTAGASSGGTATITAVGNGYYRCSVTVTATVATASSVQIRSALTSSTTPSSYAGNGTSGIYIYGAQLEIGSTANTYIPTTTTAVYGTPTLSFSGVAGLGLQSDGSLYVSPAGTGALQAQATTSSTVGGNARGANAVDWQTSRGAAIQVASGQYSVVAGGVNNTVTSFGGVVAGGSTNQASSNIYTVVGGGLSNAATGERAAIVGGSANTAAGYLNFVGSGFTNSATSGSAVTTQSATMNATTAVTLSGSNASIKVGQYIAGTSIATNTYVAAISGTSLTLSQAASGSSTSTLSFYTPHGVVVGGGNNQATGSYSFIGGGGDAGTAANRNVASGDWSVVGGGTLNTASGLGSVVCGGGIGVFSAAAANIASGSGSFIGGGSGNTATAAGATVLGGASNTANGSYSTVFGYQGSARGITQSFIFGTPRISVNGDSQAGIYIERVQTTDATATVLTTNGSAAGSTNQVILPNNSAYYFKVRVIAGVTGAGNTKAWTLEGAIKRGANAASTAIVGTVTTTIVAADVGAATWTVTATADTSNGGLAITVTGQASTTIRWVAKAETAEMTF